MSKKILLILLIIFVCFGCKKEETKEEIISTVSESSVDQILAGYLEDLKSADENARIKALKDLLEYQEKGAAPIFRKYLTDPSFKVRMTAGLCLDSLSDEPEPRFFKQVLDEQAGRFKQELDKTGSERIRPEIIKEAVQKAGSVREWVETSIMMYQQLDEQGMIDETGLGYQGMESVVLETVQVYKTEAIEAAVNTLAKLNLSNPRIKRATIKLLAAIGKETIPFLEKLNDDPNAKQEVKDAVAIVIKRINDSQETKEPAASSIFPDPAAQKEYENITREFIEAGKLAQNKDFSGAMEKLLAVILQAEEYVKKYPNEAGGHLRLASSYFTAIMFFAMMGKQMDEFPEGSIEARAGLKAREGVLKIQPELDKYFELANLDDLRMEEAKMMQKALDEEKFFKVKP